MAVARNLASSTPGRTLRDLGRRAGLPDFFAWWSGELARLVPTGTRASFKRRRLRPALVFGTDTATLWRPVTRDGETFMEAAEEIALGGDPAVVAANGRAALDRIADGAPPRIVIALAPKQVLRRTLTLPAAIEENLNDALAFDLDRHTPFKADELYFDAQIVQRDAMHGVIKVDLAAVRRSIVDQALLQAESWGAVVVAVAPDSPSTLATSRHNLLPEERRAIGGAWRWQLWIPLILVLALATFAAVLPVWQKREYAIALLRMVDEARTQAAVSERLRGDLDRLVGEFNFALERKFAFPSSLQVLDEITKLLPDDTWLTQMELKTSSRSKETQRELLLRGESGNAGRLITLFEESTVFTQAAPRSPTTKIQPGPGEIFDLVAQLRALAPPKPVVLASNAPRAAEEAEKERASRAAPAATAAPGQPAPGTAAPPQPAPAAKAAPAAPAPSPAGAPPSQPPAAIPPSQPPAATPPSPPPAAAPPQAAAPPPVVSAPAPTESPAQAPKASEARKPTKS